MTYGIDTRNCYLQQFISAAVFDIYMLLLSENGLSTITKLTHEIEPKLHGKWNCPKDGFTGRIVYMKPTTAITLAMHHTDFPAYHASIVTLLIEEQTNGCFLFINHYGIPTELQNNCCRFWEQKILMPLSEYYDGLNLNAALFEE